MLRLHDADCLLRAKKRAGKICADDGGPLLEGEVLDCDARGIGACIIEEQIQAAELVADDIEERLDGVRLADVGDYGNDCR